MQENPEYSVFSLQTMGFYCIFVGLFRKLGIFAKSNPKVGQNVYKFNRIFRKIGIFGAKYPIITRSATFCFPSGNSSQMSANSIEFSEKSGNSGQNVQHFSQMATLIVDFPEYSGYSNHIVTSSWGFFRKFGKLLS